MSTAIITGSFAFRQARFLTRSPAGTGHFRTLASCNVNGCGMPNATRAKLVALIDEGKNDRQIFDLLSKERGPTLVKPHLLP
jgi:hypothetical protein